jgi:hypothetical protein
MWTRQYTHTAQDDLTHTAQKFRSKFLIGIAKIAIYTGPPSPQLTYYTVTVEFLVFFERFWRGEPHQAEPISICILLLPHSLFP